MKKTTLLILFFLISSFVSAQKFCLKDKITNEKIQYAHIAFSNNGKGTYSDSDGFFELKENVDSLYITHIGFRDTIISTKNLSKVIYLNSSENQLKSIEVSSTNKSKRFDFLLRKKAKVPFNLPSIEIGTTSLSKDYQNWNFIREIRIPIKLGKDTPILRVNIYRFDSETMKPSLPIWSALVKEENYKKNEIIFEDLLLDIQNEEAIFASLDIVSYDVNNVNAPIHVSPYSNSRDAMKIWLRRREGSYCMFRNKRVDSGWVSSLLLDLWHYEKEPIIHLEIE